MLLGVSVREVDHRFRRADKCSVDGVHVASDEYGVDGSEEILDVLPCEIVPIPLALIDNRGVHCRHVQQACPRRVAFLHQVGSARLLERPED